MKQYLLAVHTVDGDPDASGSETETAFKQVALVNAEMQAAGVWVFGGGLVSPESSTVVEDRNGSTTMTDGPFAETKEQLGGFWILRCTDLDQALSWASKASAACLGPVEVRPFEDDQDNCVRPR